MEFHHDPLLPDHNLCGYLCAVLTLASSSPLPRAGTLLRVIRHNASVAFTSADGVVLSPPRIDAAPEPKVLRTPTSRGSGKKRKATKGGDSSEGKRTGIRRPRSAGMVSVAEQLNALVAHKCLCVAARVVWTEAGDGGGGEEARAVVLVDVYLPSEVWSGWQFPKSGSVAGALFRHLSCDWERRRSIIASEVYVRDALAAGSKMWNLSDCHVLGCELHHNVAHPPKKKLFELHEIFKGLPSVATMVYTDPSRIQPVDDTYKSGIWDLSDDILIKILAPLGPEELVRVAGTCHQLRFLAALIMPSMKLKLFPHQQAAVKWMLQREQHPEVLPNPLYMAFSTEDGLAFHVSTISGEIVPGEAPTINDFRGGLFCDEPGLGKTITALSLILKTRGKLPDPPDCAQVTWCTHNGDSRCGYYDLNGAYLHGGKSDADQNTHTDPEKLGYHSSKRSRLVFLNEQPEVGDSCYSKQTCSEPAIRANRSTRGLNSVRKNLIFRLDDESDVKWYEVPEKRKRSSKNKNRQHENNDTWAQCDSCSKWRKLRESRISDAATAWFCSMNSDLQYQSCSVPEEAYDNCEPITYFHGFYSKGTSGGENQNVSFFASVLKRHHSLINSTTKKALSWLLKLSPEKISEMETIGVRTPFISMYVEPNEDARSFQKIFKSFGLRKVVEKGIVKWFYPRNLQNLVFDISALRTALCTPLDSIRLYLSKATLVVVPANLVDHWRTQIQKHVRPQHLRVYIWTDHKNPNTHSLAWDYDVVITTFSRLSAEWGAKKRSAMRQVHWLRIILDEGHTLGSSVALTNKLQMAVSLVASNRWILTGTPTPNTPNSQLSHLQPLLKFLHEEAFGQNQKSWEAGILKPFEAETEEGRARLLHLLHRCMISARKADLRQIPPCIKKVKLLDFTAEHARSYNELAVTVRRNILMADWNDPSHVESLLNPKQWKFRSATIKNVRLSCCVAGHIKVKDAGHDIQETMDILVQTGLDPKSEEYAFIKYNLLDGGNCVRCGEWCRLPVITPCRHILCQECVALDSERCTVSGCGNSYEMQTPDTLARPENPNPKWPVPKDLIELQPSYKQDNWDPDWQSTSSSKVSYLISRLKELQAANSDSCWAKDDGADVDVIHDFLGSSWMRNSVTMNRNKVLVFSQFLEHIHVIEQQLSVAGINFAGMYSPMQTSNKMKSLTMFQNDEDCMVLLMDGSAALGLDLSFVSHVFLMEPIWDKSMEEQVISRAHRMGATRPIHVETLAMRSTIEEHMLSFLQDSEACRDLLKTEIGKTESEGSRTHRSLHDFAENNYLSRLTFVRINTKN